jgi:hypothetical protein
MLLSGCAQRSGETASIWQFIGFTSVRTLPTASAQPQVEVRQVRNVGFAIGPSGSIAVGYNKHKFVALPPEGGLFIEVHSMEQLEGIKQFLAENPALGATSAILTTTRTGNEKTNAIGPPNDGRMRR